MSIKQKTLNSALVFQGIGVHSGVVSKVTLRPAQVDSGVEFYNPLFPNEPFRIGKFIPEQAAQATVLKQKSWVLSTVEHLLAAIVYVGLDNVSVEIDGYEIPILDGSALPFVHAILDTGFQTQHIDKKYATPKHTLFFRDSKMERSIEIIPAEQYFDGTFDHQLTIDYVADFTHKLIGVSSLTCSVTTDFFSKEIAPARTFGFLEQLPHIRKMGLAKGASLGNTVILNNEGLLNGMRFSDECVRHKILDLMGDLGLIGVQLIGNVKACRTGHNFNREVVASFVSEPEKWLLL